MLRSRCWRGRLSARTWTRSSSAVVRRSRPASGRPRATRSRQPRRGALGGRVRGTRRAPAGGWAIRRRRSARCSAPIACTAAPTTAARPRGSPCSCASASSTSTTTWRSAVGWVERAERLLEGVPPGAEHGWVELLRGHLAHAGRARPGRARAPTPEGPSDRPRERRRRRRDDGARPRGAALVCEGEIDDGMRRLDEATAATVAGELDDLDAISSCCCYLIDACKRVRDFERASQWCEHVKGFCEQWSDRLTFAACRAHYADILIWRGEWSEAEAELRSSLGAAGRHPPQPDRRRHGPPGRAAPPPGPARRGRRGCSRRPAATSSRRWSARRSRWTAATLRPPRTRPSARCAACRRGRDRPRAGAGDPRPRAARPARTATPRARRPTELRAIAASARAPPPAPPPRRARTGLLAAARRAWEAARAEPSRTPSTSTPAPAGAGRAPTRGATSRARCARSATTGRPSARRAPPTRRCARLGAGAPASADAAAAPAGLTARELEVLRLIARGRSNARDRRRAGAQRPHRRAPHRQHLRQDRRVGRAARAAAASYALAAGVA